MDKLSRERRSWNMSMIRAKNTKPEVFVRSMLHKRGYRFRIHLKDLPGKPDIVLPKYHTVIFVHGCFWHGHEKCKDYAPPKTNTEWWLRKINGNRKKDMENIVQLEKLGWRVIVTWECQLTPSERENTIRFIAEALNDNQKQL